VPELAIEGHKPVRPVRLTNGQAAVVSVSLAPDQHGRGHGTEIILMGTRELWATALA
jgi:hypothetical protein